MKKRIALVLVLALSLISVFALCVSADTCAHENQECMPEEGYGSTRHCFYCYDCKTELSWADCVGQLVDLGNGKHVNRCSECGNYLSSVSSHEFDGGVYTDDGMKYTCVCGYAYTEALTCAHEISHYESEGLSSHICKCDVCGEIIAQSEDHYWNSGVVTKQPTDTENGVKTFTCVACGEIKTEILYVSGTCTCRVHEAWSYADCGAEGHRRKCPDCFGLYGAIESHDFSRYSEYNSENHFVICSVCYYNKVESCQFDVKYIDSQYHQWVCKLCRNNDGALESHKFDGGVYTDDGMKYTCFCGYTYTEALTCAHEKSHYESEGVSSHICKCDDCGEIIAQSEDHYWNSGVVTKQPTDTENGVKTFTCVACGEIKTEILYVSGTCTCTVHEAWSYADCGAEGHRRKCPDCFGLYGAIESHDFSRYSEYNSESHFVICSVCYYNKVEPCQLDVKYIDSQYHQWVCKLCRNADVELESHTWDAGVVTKQPTTTENGVRTFTCTTCNGTKTETIDYIDLDELLENITQAEATDLYKKIFDKYQTELVKDGDVGYWYDEYFAKVIFPDLNKNGVKSSFYSPYGDLYSIIANECAENTIAYELGYQDAISAVINDNPVQGLFQGMFAGMMSFYGLLAGGISIGGITLGSVVTTFFIIMLVAFVVKLLRRS